MPSLPSRNDRCPCGSGSKFKKCCENSVSFDERKILAAEARNPGMIQQMIMALDQEIERRDRRSDALPSQVSVAIVTGPMDHPQMPQVSTRECQFIVVKPD